jgi:predicted DCC family thiol-disulfide oxidoreductase YuxK
VAAALCLCSPILLSPTASGFTTVPSSVSSLQAGPRSAPIPRLQVSISTGSVQPVERGDERYESAQVNSQSVAKSSSQREEKTPADPSGLLEWDWKGVMQEIWKTDQRDIILFDGECNLCNGGVNMLLDLDTSNEFRFCSLHSNFAKSMLVACGKHPEDRDSIMVISPVNPDAKIVKSKYLEKSEAVMRIASKLAGAPKWVKAMTAVGDVAPKSVSDWILQIIANNRHKIELGEEYSSCRLDFDGEYDGRFLNDYEHEHLFEPMDEDKLRDKYSSVVFS